MVIDVWKLADELHLTIVDHVDGHVSGYTPDDGTIRLTPGMKGRVHRSVLAHEIAHHVLGHRPVQPGLWRSRQEAAANRWAALHLIDADEYAAAEQARNGHLPSMAVDLYVADELVEVYQQNLERIGDLVYLRPGLGVGDWLLRKQVA